ncbi:MAG: PSD1 and planctomycete cytochrome C domain-containing protein [Prosthecobacter sp.]
MPRRAVIASLLLTAPAHAAVDYATQIKPLLQQHCVKCHGTSTQKSSLRLDTAAAAQKGGKRGPALPELLVQAVSGTHAEIPQMPYKRGPLDSAQIALIKQWVAEGAKAPADEAPSDDRHWAFVPPVKTPLPAGSSAHPIDAFIQARLAKDGLTLSPPAPKGTLLRRLALDLTGLPPTPAEVQAFTDPSDRTDPTDPKYMQHVERLLKSPHHGERWGRWWLDQARYADSNGYSIDAPRSMWPYRDWVVGAFNQDLPFDQFTLEQIAGDLLPSPSREQVIATGFHRNTQINQEGGIDKEQFRIESVFDRVATTGTVWLGLTIGCAQCHDHKFDPISQREYYQFFAFLNNQEEPTLPVPDPNLDTAKLTKESKDLQEKITAYIQQHQQTFTEWEAELGPASIALMSKDQQKALKVAAAKRSFYQNRTLFTAGPGAADQVFRSLNERLTEVDAQLRNGTTTLVMKELAQPRKTTIYIKGDFTRPADEVQAAVPAVLHALPATKTSKPDRLALAQWLVDRKNPLTARVLVNRVWQQYFGRGLVETENDFGTMGSLPTHPELLDWLAIDFMEHGWSFKHLHRLIVTSQAYQQSSGVRAEGTAVDPDNRLLWHQNRIRLDAEVVRDVCLTASGLLAPKMGGPPVYPPIPEGVLSLGQVKRSWPLSQGADRYRRGLYTFVFRATPPPALSVFDAPDGFSTCTRRIRSNTPLQALTLLNDGAAVEFAQALATRLGREAKTEGQRLSHAFQVCVSRPPSTAEQQALTRLLQAERAAGATDAQAWEAVGRVMLNLDETITRE